MRMRAVCLLSSQHQVVCALRLRCIVDSKYTTWVNTKFEIAITRTIIENPSFYSDIHRFGWSSYTSVVVINVWLCCLTGYVLRRRKK